MKITQTNVLSHADQMEIINLAKSPAVGSLKTALQTAFNSVVMAEGENGNNSIIAKSKDCRVIIMTCGNMDYKNFQANFGQSKTWQKQFLAFLNRAAEGKEFVLTFGDPEDQSTENAAEDSAEESEATTEETKAE